MTEQVLLRPEPELVEIVTKICSNEFDYALERHYCTLPPGHKSKLHKCSHHWWISQKQFGHLYVLKCANHYSKFSNPLGTFTEIRKSAVGYSVGSIVTMITPLSKFDATIVKRKTIRKSDITEELAQSDADCSREALLKKLEEWYGEDTERLLLLTLERVP